MCIELEGSDLQHTLEEATSQRTVWIAFIKPQGWHFVTFPCEQPIGIPGRISHAADCPDYRSSALTKSSQLQGLFLFILQPKLQSSNLNLTGSGAGQMLAFCFVPL